MKKSIVVAILAVAAVGAGILVYLRTKRPKASGDMLPGRINIKFPGLKMPPVLPIRTIDKPATKEAYVPFKGTGGVLLTEDRVLKYLPQVTRYETVNASAMYQNTKKNPTVYYVYRAPTRTNPQEAWWSIEAPTFKSVFLGKVG